MNLTKITDNFKVYLKYLRINFYANFQYKGWPIMVLQVLIVVIADPVGLIMMFLRFGNIGSWSLERIIFMYAVSITSFGLAETFARGFDYFPWRMIQSGEFDRVLLRPKPLAVQIMGSYFHIHRLSRVAAGLFVIAWSLKIQNVQLDIMKITVLLLTLLGGFILYTGVFIISSGIAFFTIKGLDWIYIFTNASSQVARCPLEYMPRILKYTFSFFVPLIFISHYPASYICGWGGSLLDALLALPASICFLLISLTVWKIGVKHYKSTGS